MYNDDGVHVYWFDVPFGITPDTHMHINVLVTRGGPCQHGRMHISIRRTKRALPLHLHYLYQRRVDTTGQVELWSPRQVTHLPHVIYFTS